MRSSRMRVGIRRAKFYLKPQYLNAVSTARTGLGFLGTFVERRLPKRFRASELTSIFNYLPISESLSTAGQPTETQLAAVKAAGFGRVINLAPHGMENSLADEAGVVRALGMDYVHIPVDFDDPTDTDFARFCSAVQDAGTDSVLVHCAANMRVSAFVFRYRTQVLGEDQALAAQDLHHIWKPFGIWAKFIEADLI